MTRHLATCPQRGEAIAKAEQGKGTAEPLYHLRVQDAYRGDFWLNLEMRGSKTLQDLDTYLRSIWLECCGHMSQFYGGGAFSNEVGKRRKVSDVFDYQGELTHVYDFGTSSETTVKLVSIREGKPLTSRPISLMARNLMPAHECQECQKPATHLCMECVYEEDNSGLLCDDHTEGHPHHNYGDPLPLVNSPRLGMCGYNGPADPPY
ncbi:MAG: hypothetical protein SFW36_15815 [Leptolyngbyaceae cyanobacterium bins.59]|nr:hypothetical protein [Leptolyngbyaceae cyanobacterium bins.59]